MSDNYVIKVCYFCDYPKNVSADYEENIDENGNYHLGTNFEFIKIRSNF